MAELGPEFMRLLQGLPPPTSSGRQEARRGSSGGGVGGDQHRQAPHRNHHSQRRQPSARSPPGSTHPSQIRPPLRQFMRSRGLKFREKASLFKYHGSTMGKVSLQRIPS